MLAYDMAQENNGAFLLRIEDIDQSRSRAHWENQIYDDLSWLGLEWPTPVMRQSERLQEYQRALDRLWVQGLLYPCSCNRKDIAAAVSAPQEGYPTHGPDGIVYPGTCRTKWDFKSPPTQPRPTGLPLRLNMALAIDKIRNAGQSLEYNIENQLSFSEIGEGPNAETGQIILLGEQLVTGVGDVVLARRGMGTSYHLSVVLDDADQGITRVVRGQDLFEATQIHVVLQRLLNLPTPAYHHHRLIRDNEGKRLAKRDDARAISKFRADGSSPADIRRLVGL